MELSLTLSNQNQYPLAALLIRGSTVEQWLQQMQQMQLNLAMANVYALPGKKANSLWGCLVVPEQALLPAIAGRAEYCQLVHNHLFIAQYTSLYPILASDELHRLLGPQLHFLHAETGLVALEQPVQWQSLLLLPQESTTAVSVPAKGVYRPGKLRGMFIQVTSPEETLEQLSKQSFPQQSPELNSKPLAWWEKLVLWLLRLLRALLRLLFWLPGLIPIRIPVKTGHTGTSSRNNNNSGTSYKAAQGKLLSWMRKMEKQYEDLEERNKKQVDKLLDLFRTNPEKALEYAVPLDTSGVHRGGNNLAEIGFSKRWSGFSLFGSNRGAAGAGAYTLPEDHYQLLNNQYRQTAADLMQNGDYQKAAFVYMKLLGDYRAAATALEKGGLYAEAAAIYIKYLKQTEEAARCYEKGNMLQQALELYITIHKHDKAGELAMLLGRNEEARHHYGLLALEYKQKKQYMNAAGVYREKLQDDETAQALLLSGWEAGQSDALRCLNTYFSHIEADAALEQQAAALYKTATLVPQKQLYLKAMGHLYQHRQAAAGTAKQIGYEIIAAHIGRNREMAEELKLFNKFDQNLTKDIQLYKQSKR
ncbi:hypothetical protein HNQ91_001675 [Filimonas zeae]|uniref:MoxR-vWA-beta-propeller ternary system domain-containing protein n=1 Tax=Filimonas zeae TaxID=1737353 RepID=A0A917IX80_9BACT|nr:hypothetical protein [Filimonas zeae]MDR6338624.1 hypothetical protein [Filimonas zeae]GGH67347.1 hypothetical protein GCM10011379_22520 [Filimonas zeae]